MKKVLNYFVVFIVYNLLGLIVWYEQDLLVPLFIATYALINVFMMDKNRTFINNFILISGVMSICILIGLIIGDSYKPLVFQYLGLMIAISLIVYYLKKNFNFNKTLLE